MVKDLQDCRILQIINIMKTVVRWVLFICLFGIVTACSSSRHGAGRGNVANIIGLWEVKAIHNSNEAGYNETPQGMFKMIMPGGEFLNFMSTDNGAIITVDGTYSLDGDIYTESIVNSFNITQEGKDNPLEIKLSHNNFMYLRWYQPVDEFGVEQNRWVEEIWQRVTTEDLEVSSVDLRQELRMLLNDDEVIKKVVD